LTRITSSRWPASPPPDKGTRQQQRQRIERQRKAHRCVAALALDDAVSQQALQHARCGALRQARHLLKLATAHGPGGEQVVQREFNLRPIDASPFRLAAARRHELADAQPHVFRIQHLAHERHLVQAQVDEEAAPLRQRPLAQVAPAVEVALAHHVGLGKMAVVLVPIARQASVRGPQAARQGPQRRMRLKARCAAIAIEERMNPGHAVVRRRSHMRQVAGEPLSTVGLVKALHEAAKGRVGRRLVAIHGDVAGSQDARLDRRALLRHAVLRRKALVELSVRGDDELRGERVRAAGDERFQGALRLDVRHRDALAPRHVGLVVEAAAQALLCFLILLWCADLQVGVLSGHTVGAFRAVRRT
jgi:hypothetical protein